MADRTPTVTSAEMQRRWNRCRVVVAFDPGKTTGCAIYDGETIECRSLDFWGAIALADVFDARTTAILVEDPRMNPFHYDRHNRQGGHAAQAKIARHVGRNQQDGARIIERFEQAGFYVKAVRPKGKKWDARLCRRFTGYDGRPNNQHVRDAIRLLFQEGVL